MISKRTILFLCIAAAILALVIWTAWGNSALERNDYIITAEKLPETFNGYRIAHVSDLHNTQIGENNTKLLAILRNAEPDLIAITGDLIDSRNTDISVALQFAEEAVKIAPCYYVTGNHEARVSDYEVLQKGLTALGVIILENDKVELELSGESIALIGVHDPSFETDYLFGNSASFMQNNLQTLIKEDTYTILLSHRPELFETYVDNGIDLVLSGHAHGGQFRLPLLGGVIAPNQGLFPKYDAGLFTSKNTSMVVSKGIGNSIIPLRFNNRPEVILITLSTE